MPSHGLLIAVEVIDLIAVILCLVIAGAIAYAARKGRPINFSREMYWTVFVLAAAAGVALLVAGQRIYLTSSAQILLHCVCVVFGLVFFGIGGGCCAAVFLYRGPIFSKLSRHNDS